MADVNANIGVNIDTSNALAQLKALQRQISQFHTSISKSSEAAALAQRDLQRNFINSVNSIGAFSAELRTVRTTAESFTDSLERNKFSMREYFRYAGGATKTFGRLFRSEFDTINKVAEENVKRLQTQYIKMGRDASGAMRAIAIIPNELDMSNVSTQLQMAAQRQALFNQLLKQGSTNLLNFGKNTQWAGRQLMVGFTLPLVALGAAASKTFMDMETAALKFRKVYGDLFTPEEERQQALADIQALGQSFTQYGISVAATVSLAADAAAAGFQGLDLQRQVTEATRLQVLGQIDQQKALETTISLQNAFRLSNDDLSDSINFLNAVENQTVVSLDDITTAIPKVAPVIMQLGGSVRDLAFFMTAMKQGGVNASEGANALKSGLAALINPTEKAAAMLATMGINIKEIVEGNQGDLRATVVDFAKALDTLDPLTRARAIEQLFGKFQFARLSTLFENVTAEGTQAARVLELAGYSVEELAATAESELGMTADTAMNKFRKTVEDLRFALVPVGQTFLEAMTPIVEFIGNLVEKFNNLPGGVKKAITLITVALGAIGPVALMTFGLIANGAANLIKGLMILRNGYLRLTGQSQILGEQTEFLSVQQQNALAVAHSLDQSHAKLIQTFTAEAGALQKLSQAYERAIAAGMNFARTNPGMMQRPLPGFKEGIISVPGSGTEDKYPAMLAAGEAVIPARQNQKYAALVQGIIADNIPGFQQGRSGYEGMISSRFLPTRAGRSATAGERAQRNIPGGYQLGHFAEPIKMTGQQLLEIAENESQTVKRAVEALINSVSGDLTKMFDVFTNEVAVQSKELNQALGEVGTGRRAPVSMFRQEAVERAGAYNAPLIAKMKEAGSSTEEIESAVTQLQQAYSQGIEGLGQATTVTAEEVNLITKQALDSVSEVNQQVRAAREQLQKPSALKEVMGVTPGRVPLSGAYNTKEVRKQINQVVQQQAPGVFPTQQAFNFFGPQARQVGIQNAEAIAQLFDQLSAEAKQRVIALLGDIDAMSQQVVIEARNAGIDIGEFAIRGITDGIDASSPSQAAKKQGQNVADGFEQGILEGMDDASLAGQKLGDAGIDGINQGTGGGAGGRGAGGAAGGAGGRGGFGGPSNNLAKFNSALMGASFALTSVSGIASAFGGRFQGLSEAIFKVSGLMFGLMSVVQLLTQEMFANVVAARANKVATAMGATSFKGLFTNVGGFGAKLLTAGKFLVRFAGPIGAVVAGLTATFSIIKMVNAARERERKAIMGLADAANMTSDKLKTLGDFFGIKPTQNPMLQAVPQIRMTAERRGRVDELKATESFRKDFANDIAELRKATAKEAEITFKSIALSLAGQGFGKEMITDVVDALREEAGKTDVKIDLKSLDLKTEEGQSGFAKLAADITNELAVAAKNGYQEVQVLKGGISETGQMYSYYAKELKPTIALQRASATAGQNLFNMMIGLSGQLKSGSIGAKEFNQGFDQLEAQIKSLEAANPGSSMLALNAAIKLLEPETQKLFVGITNNADAMLMLRAQALGLTAILPGLASAIKQVNAGYTGDATALVQAQMNLDRYKKMIIDAAKVTEEEIKKILGTQTGGDGEKSIFQKAIEQLKQQREELTNTSTAYNKLKKAGIETSRAFEIASDPILAAAIASTKVGTKQWNQLLTLIKQVNKELIKGELKNFFQTRNAEVKFKKAFADIIPMLQGLGLEAEDIQEILSNPVLAKEFIKDLEDGQLDANRLRRYIEQIPELKKIEILLEAKDPEEAFREDFGKIMDYFDILEKNVNDKYEDTIRAQEDVIDNLRKKIEGVNREIAGIQETIDDKQRDIEVNISRRIEDYQEQISDLQRTLELNIDRPIEELNRQIGNLQRDIELQFDRPIGALQEESSDLANDLTLIDKAAEAINAKYDAQEQALQKISEVNQEIIGQEKQRVSIADALTRGDIASAAQAMQEARAQAASAAAQRAQGTLQAARGAELAGLRGATSGLTREQIEQRQFQIGQQIFALEERRDVVQAQILAKQDQIYEIEKGRASILAAIKIIEDQIYDLEELREVKNREIRDLEDDIYDIKELRLEQLEIELQGAEDVLDFTTQRRDAELDAIAKQKEYYEDMLLELENAKIKAGEYDGVLAGIKAKAEATLKSILALNTTVTTTHIINTITNSSGGGGGQGSAQAKMYGGKIKKMAAGGFVPGKGMTDKVPALLTPGEFVINKNATKSFGPLLSKINESKYPSMMKDSLSSPAYMIAPSTSVFVPNNTVTTSVSDNSSTVYNYSVGITVGGTNASPDAIAKTVMNEIKYIDSQRIRGQRA